MLRGLAVFSMIGGLAVAVAGCGGSDPQPKQGSGGSFQKQVDQALKEPSAELRAAMLIELGGKQHKAKDMLGAEKTLGLAAKACEKIQKPESRAASFARLAETQVAADNRLNAKRSLASARKAAEKIEDPESKALALATLGATQAALKDLLGADETLKAAETMAGKLADPLGKTTVLNAIARSYRKTDQDAEVDRVLAAALATAQGIEDARKQSDAIAEVAATQSGLKRKGAAKTFELALESARKIAKPTSQAYALMDIAQKLSKARRHAQTHEVLKEAEAVAKKIEEVDLQRQAKEKVLTLKKKLPAPA